MAVANYHSMYGSLPPPYLTDASGRPVHSWRILLLPFLGQEELYARYDFHEPWDGPNNRKLLDSRPKVYGLHDPSSQQGNVTNYLAVIGKETAWQPGSALAYDQITDGTSATVLVVENLGSGILWTEPRDLDFAAMTMTIGAANGISSTFEPPGGPDGRWNRSHNTLADFAPGSSGATHGDRRRSGRSHRGCPGDCRWPQPSPEDDDRRQVTTFLVVAGHLLR